MPWRGDAVGRRTTLRRCRRRADVEVDREAGAPAATAHSGSQCGSPMHGQAEALRLAGEQDAAVPERRRSARSPRTVASMSQNGVAMIGSSRPAVGRRPVARGSRCTRVTHSSFSSSSAIVRKRWLPEAADVRVEHLRPDRRPRPCSARRAWASYAPRVHVLVASAGTRAGTSAILRARSPRPVPIGLPSSTHTSRRVVAHDVRHVVEVLAPARATSTRRAAR